MACTVCMPERQYVSRTSTNTPSTSKIKIFGSNFPPATRFLPGLVTIDFPLRPFPVYLLAAEEPFSSLAKPSILRNQSIYSFRCRGRAHHVNRTNRTQIHKSFNHRSTVSYEM